MDIKWKKRKNEKGTYHELIILHFSPVTLSLTNVGVFSSKKRRLCPVSAPAFRCIKAMVEVYVIRIIVTHIKLNAETGVENAKGAIFEGLLSAHSHAF